MRKNKGVVSIEFALTTIPLVFAFVTAFEIARFVATVNAIDIALMESTRLVKKERVNTEAQINYIVDSVINNESGYWHWFVDVSGINKNVTYINNLSNIASSSSISGNSNNSQGNIYPLVIYNLSYEYTPHMFSQGFVSEEISRSTIMVLEHAGW